MDDRAVWPSTGMNATARSSLRSWSVGLVWHRKRTSKDWLDGVRAVTDNQIAAFDFPLRYKLKDSCDTLQVRSAQSVPADGSVIGGESVQCRYRR